MTREEAIKRLKEYAQYAYGIWHNEEEDTKAFDMAIEALSAEPNKAVPPSLADVYKWERDIALSQLEEYGICFGEKKRDDLVEVVRCKDCRYAHECHKSVQYTRNEQNTVTIGYSPIKWCSRGESKGGDDE